MENLIIRTVQQTDLKELGTLYYQLSEEASNFDKMTDIFQKIYANKNYFLYGAFYNNVLAGSLMCIKCYDLVGECQPFMLIENVIVDKNYQHKGIGKRLIIEAELLAKNNNCTYIIFTSGINRTNAHKFYESLGYSNSVTQGYKKRLKDFATNQTSPLDLP
jgi:phosphoglycolate phosphatase